MAYTTDCVVVSELSMKNECVLSTVMVFKIVGC